MSYNRTKFDAARSTYNFTPSSTRYLRAAMARALSGGTNAHLAFLGDSTTQGSTEATSVPGVFRSILTAKGVPARGTGIVTAARLQAGSDTMYATTGTVQSFGSAPNGAGAYMTTGSTITFGAGVTAAELFTVYYVKRASSAGTITATMDGGAATSVNTSGAAAYATQTYSVAAGTHSLVLSGPAAGNGFFWGIEAREGGATGGVRVSNIGRSGGATPRAVETNYDSAPNSSPLPGIDALDADVLFINLGINDYLAAGDVAVQTPLATYLANIGSLIARQQASGGVAGTGGGAVLVAFNPQQTAKTIPQASYWAQLYALADTYNVPLIDIPNRWESYTVSSALGHYNDGTHPNAQGYRDIAGLIYEAIASTGCGI